MSTKPKRVEDQSAKGIAHLWQNRVVKAIKLVVKLHTSSADEAAKMN